MDYRRQILAQLPREPRAQARSVGHLRRRSPRGSREITEWPGEYPELEAKVATLLAPIAGPKPSGEDVSFDPDFERVKAEVDKLGSVSSGLPDWRGVVDLSGKLLSTRSKDMRLATWLTLAKMNLAGWTGLAEGLIVLRELSTTHWDTMYPERRPRARANLYGWLVEHIATTLEPLPVVARRWCLHPRDQRALSRARCDR